jgi:hypothetical protein
MFSGKGPPLLDELELVEETELLEELLEEELLLDELLELLLEELLDETELALLEDELELLDTVPSHRVPVTVGCSITPPLVSPWKPNSTLCPGAIPAFHPRFVAV